MDPLTREETETLEMLYRHQREFAVGHGISVHATLPEPLAERATQVETEWVPMFEVPQQTPRSAADDENLAGLTMDMKELAELPKDGFDRQPAHIETAYRVWIQAEAAKLTSPAEKLAGHEEAAKRAVDTLHAGARTHQSRDRPHRDRPAGGGGFSLRQPRHVAAAHSLHLCAQGAQEGDEG